MRVTGLKPLSVCSTNCYIVVSDKMNAALIDAPDDAEYILSCLERDSLTLKKILLTHGHCDHINAVADLVKATGCEVCIHEADNKMLKGSEDNLGLYINGEPCNAYDGAITVKDGDEIALDEITFRVMHTPGHTKGSVCYIADSFMFSGDTLFCGSIGRTDFPGSNMNEMKASLKKLIALEDDYYLFSGHGEDSRLSCEKADNFYLRSVDRLKDTY